MIKKHLFSLTFLLTFTTLLYCSCSKKLPSKELTIKKADGTSIQISAELAITPEQRNHGFMERKNIPNGTGMIFIFEKDQILSFWMKNTPHPLSIAYIDSKGVIRNIYDMTPYSLSPIISTVSVRYALEVPKGWYTDNNIQIGDKILLDFID